MDSFHIGMFFATFFALVVGSVCIGLYDNAFPNTIALYWSGVAGFIIFAFAVLNWFIIGLGCINDDTNQRHLLVLNLLLVCMILGAIFISVGGPSPTPMYYGGVGAMSVFALGVFVWIGHTIF